MAGRGLIKRDGDALSEAERLVKKPKATSHELKQVLRRMIHDHEALRSRYNKLASERDRAYALLQDKYQTGQDDQEDGQRAEVIADMLGTGYNSQRTFDRHKALALGYVKNLWLSAMLKIWQVSPVCFIVYVNVRTCKTLRNDVCVSLMQGKM